MKPKPFDLEELKEEIRKRIYDKDYPEAWSDFQEIAEMFSLFDLINQCIKSACEFYLRYKDNPDLLIEEHPEYKKEVERFKIPQHWVMKYNDIDIQNKLDDYNIWLFKLAFKDALATEERQNSTSKENSEGDSPMKA